MESTHDWSRPLKDELDRPVELRGKEFILKGSTKGSRHYGADLSPTWHDLDGNLDFPQGILRYADEPDADGWYHYTPIDYDIGPDGVSIETHEIKCKLRGIPSSNWRVLRHKGLLWDTALTYRYRPLASIDAVAIADALADFAKLPDADLNAALEIIKAELDRREQTEERAFVEVLADAYEASGMCFTARHIKSGECRERVAEFMARFTIKDQKAGDQALGLKV
jgi:hypothetical protein